MIPPCINQQLHKGQNGAPSSAQAQHPAKGLVQSRSPARMVNECHLKEVIPSLLLRKWLQKCSRMSLTEANLINYLLYLVKICRPPTHLPQVCPSTITPQRKSEQPYFGGGAVGFSKLSSSLLHLSFFSASLSYPGASEANIPFLSHP